VLSSDLCASARGDTTWFYVDDRTAAVHNGPRPFASRALFSAALAAGMVASAVACAAHLPPDPTTTKARRALFLALMPSSLTNCRMKRYGETHDGGYLMCANLMSEVRAAYSYGINGYDQWGCDISKELGVTVHEYDCFNASPPSCDRGVLVFHEECIGDRAETREGRPFDTLNHQVAKNGDAGKHLIVKIDVEGAEWGSLLAASDSVLDLIDQMAIEFHGTDEASYLDTVTKLAAHFVVAHVHANNNACNAWWKPFRSWANEALLVNKQLAIVDRSAFVPPGLHALDAPNNPAKPDCPVSIPNPRPPA